MSDRAAELLELVRAAAPGDLLPLMRAFDLAREAALLRLLQPVSARLLTCAEAAELAGVPERRVRAWSRRAGASWGSRPTRRTLRVDEALFRAWLASNGRQRLEAVVELRPGTPRRTLATR